jgi:hypothetical protein
MAVKLAFWAATSTSAQRGFDSPEEAYGETLALLSAWRAAVNFAGLPKEFGMEEHKAWRARRDAEQEDDPDA